MSTPHAQDLSLRGINSITNAYKFLMDLPAVSLTDCHLCMQTFNSGPGMEPGRILPCLHAHCKECTMDWFHPCKYRNTCPVCFVELFQMEDIEDGDRDGDEDEDEGDWDIIDDVGYEDEEDEDEDDVFFDFHCAEEEDDEDEEDEIFFDFVDSEGEDEW